MHFVAKYFKNEYTYEFKLKTSTKNHASSADDEHFPLHLGNCNESSGSNKAKAYIYVNCLENTAFKKFCLSNCHP